MFRNFRDIARTPLITAPANPHEAVESNKKDGAGSATYYQCDFCSDGWQSETDVFIHKKLMHSLEINKLLNNADKENVCLHCIKPFNSDEELQKHIRIEHLISSEMAQRIEREIFVCDTCSQLFFNKHMLVVHMAQVHKTIPKRRRIECPNCHKMTRCSTLYTHFRLHDIQSLTCCPICFTKCNARQDMLEHFKSHPSHYYCDPCGFDLCKLPQFEQHINEHKRDMKLSDVDTSDIDRYFKYFVRRGNVLRCRFLKFQPFRGLTIPEKLQICILCRHMCSSEAEMKWHIQNHGFPKAIEPKVMHGCTCGEQFSVNVLLKHHIFKMKGDNRIHKAIISK